MGSNSRCSIVPRTGTTTIFGCILKIPMLRILQCFGLEEPEILLYSSTLPKVQCSVFGDLSMGDVLGPPVVCYIHPTTCIQIWISVYIYIHICVYLCISLYIYISMLCMRIRISDRISDTNTYTEQRYLYLLLNQSI